MANYKVPSQATSGGDTFSDALVGNQITNGSNQMTGGNFAIETVIPEKDSKEFRTQPFSEFLTLNDINSQSPVNANGTSSVTTNNEIKFNNDNQSGNRSLYGSLKQRIGVAVNNIISKYPAAVLVDVSSPIGTNKNSAENAVYSFPSNTTQFQVQYSLLYNPLDVVLITPKSNTLPVVDNSIRNFYSSYTQYVIDLSGITFNIVSYSEPNSNNIITLTVDGNCFNGSTGFTQNYLIRPNNGVVEQFYTEIDDLEQVLVNRSSNPKFNAGFNVPRDTNGGSTTETITVYANWPVSRDGWNIQILGLDFSYYVEQLTSIADDVDDFKSNLIIRFLTSPQLFEFDTDDQKIASIFQIYGQSFDKVKVFIDNIASMRNVTYDGINNVPDVLLKNLAETLGMSTINLFDEKSLQDSLYTRHNVQYSGVSNGVNLVEAEFEFYRRLLVNLANLYKSKGTRSAIEFFLKFIGAPEPMIRLDEYVYKVDSVLPSTNVEADIRDTIMGVKTFNYASPLTGVTGSTIIVTGYTLTQLSGSTTLSRSEYPVDEETGLPRKATSSDGTVFFETGAGWYKKTLDHRSPDILDTENSDLNSRVKVIKTMSKPFTYGEDYFNVFRQLPGLDYGYDLSSAIDNKKAEIVTDEFTSHLTLNRKNINVFLSADRAIDYDIYRKSRDLSLNFGVTGSTLMPATGVTFADFLSQITSEIITNSNVIKYKNSYADLSQVYNRYQQSIGFNPYHYITVEEFINRLTPYWVNIIDQFIPATTLWMGGNVIENGVFNRSKYKHIQPSLPVSYTEILYPNFETVIREDLDTIMGGGTIDNNNNLLAFTSTYLFSGVTFDIFLNINGVIYSGVTETFEPFSGSNVSLTCGYTIFNGGDSIAYIKGKWEEALNELINDINTGNTSSSGFTITVNYFMDTDGVDKVKFTILSHDYYGFNNGIFEYFFLPLYYYGINSNAPRIYDYGLKSDSTVYKIIGSPTITTYQDLISAISGGSAVETLVSSLITGDVVLSITLISCELLTSGQFHNSSINGFQFAFEYVQLDIHNINEFDYPVDKTYIINDEIEVLPTIQVLVFSNKNTALEDVPYGFVYKYPADLYIGDFLINQFGFPITVTGVTIDSCRTDVYRDISISDDILAPNIIINGKALGVNKIILSYPQTFIPSTPTPTPTISVTPTITPTPTVTPSISVSVTPSISITPTTSISLTPAITPSETPSVTPSITISVTPSTTPPRPSSTPAPQFVDVVVLNTGAYDMSSVKVNNVFCIGLSLINSGTSTTGTTNQMGLYSVTFTLSDSVQNECVIINGAPSDPVGGLSGPQTYTFTNIDTTNGVTIDYRNTGCA